MENSGKWLLRYNMAAWLFFKKATANGCLFVSDQIQTFPLPFSSFPIRFVLILLVASKKAAKFSLSSIECKREREEATGKTNVRSLSCSHTGLFILKGTL